MDAVRSVRETCHKVTTVIIWCTPNFLINWKNMHVEKSCILDETEGN